MRRCFSEFEGNIHSEYPLHDVVFDVALAIAMGIGL